jgi:hypothetical protein
MARQKSVYSKVYWCLTLIRGNISMLISFDNLIVRFGEVSAWHYLTEIEKAAGICTSLSLDADPEARLTLALQAQDMAHTPRLAA